MAQLTITNLDDAVMKALKERALAMDLSTEETARRLLTVSLGLDREAALARLRELRSQIKLPHDDEPAEVLIRRMRDERTAHLDQLSSP